MPPAAETKSFQTFAESWKRFFKNQGQRPVEGEAPSGFAGGGGDASPFKISLPPAFLFSGSSGSAKNQAAEFVATTLGATSPSDLIRITPEKNRIKIEPIRDLLPRLSLKSEKFTVILIEGAETMTTAAANALLKTLEEPPPNVLFILLTDTEEVLLPTIRSRCQRVRFPVSSESVRDHYSKLFSESAPVIQNLFTPDPRRFSKASRMAEELASEPEEIPPFFELLQSVWHDLAVLKGAGDDAKNLLIPAALDLTKREAARRDPDRLFEEMDLILETERAVEGNVLKQLALERLFVGLMR